MSASQLKFLEIDEITRILKGPVIEDKSERLKLYNRIKTLIQNDVWYSSDPIRRLRMLAIGSDMFTEKQKKSFLRKDFPDDDKSDPELYDPFDEEYE